VLGPERAVVLRELLQELVASTDPDGGLAGD
jgi:hypothetical protein